MCVPRPGRAKPGGGRGVHGTLDKMIKLQTTTCQEANAFGASALAVQNPEFVRPFLAPRFLAEGGKQFRRNHARDCSPECEDWPMVFRVLPLPANRIASRRVDRGAHAAVDNWIWDVRNTRKCHVRSATYAEPLRKKEPGREPPGWGRELDYRAAELHRLGGAAASFRVHHAALSRWPRRPSSFQRPGNVVHDGNLLNIEIRTAEQCENV